MPPTTDLSVRQSITVDAPPEHAFAVFTADLASWWPLETYHIGSQPAVAVVVEPRAGGRWYERARRRQRMRLGSRARVGAAASGRARVADLRRPGSTIPPCTPRSRSASTPQEGGRTRVELEHRGLEAYGDRAQEMRDTFGSPEGWAGLLTRFAGTATER